MEQSSLRILSLWSQVETLPSDKEKQDIDKDIDKEGKILASNIQS